MISLSSPTKTQPRTNPYFSPPKSPKSEFGPFKSHVRSPSSQAPPPLPPNSPSGPFQPSINPKLPPKFPVTPSLPISKSCSHQSLPLMFHSNISKPTSPVKKTSFNPFLTSPVSSSCPPIKTVSNPFRAPLSSLPPEDPEDSSRLLGVDLFTKLLSSTESNSTTVTASPCVNTNNVSDPLTLTAPPPAATLPPVTRKVTTAPASVAGDKYSALKELDDLFRTTNITEPTPAAAQPDLSGGLFSSSQPAPIPHMANTQNGAWANNSSPATSTWTSSSPMWSQDHNTTSGWPDSGHKHLSAGMNSSASTNPFGTSPSNTTLGQVFSGQFCLTIHHLLYSVSISVNILLLT